MLYVKPNVLLFIAMDNEYSLQLGCDRAVSFVCQALSERIKKKRGKMSENVKYNKLAKTLITKTSYLGRV